MEASTTVNAPHPDAPPEDDFFGVGAATPAPEPAQASPEAATAAAPVPAAETPAPTPVAEQEPAETSPADVDGAVKKKPPIDREYIIYQPVKLTEATLTALLKEVQTGDGGSVREVLFELDRVTTRTTKEAAGQTYNKHKASLPEKVSLNVVSASSMQTKTIAPKERPVEVTLDIS
jgi:hypothetical protein